MTAKPDVKKLQSILLQESVSVTQRRKHLEEATELAEKATRTAALAWQGYREGKGLLSVANDLADRASSASDAVLRCSASLKDAESRLELAQSVVRACGMETSLRVEYLKEHVKGS